MSGGYVDGAGYWHPYPECHTGMTPPKPEENINYWRDRALRAEAQVEADAKVIEAVRSAVEKSKPYGVYSDDWQKICAALAERDRHE